MNCQEKLLQPKSIARRIAFVIPKLAGGGAEFVAVQWAQQLAAEGHDVSLITTHEQAAHPPSNIRYVNLPGNTFMRRLRALRRFCLEHDVRILIGLMPYWNLLAIAIKSLLAMERRCERPIVMLSGHTIESSYGAKRGIRFKIQTKIGSLVFRHADAYLTASHSVASEAIARYKIKRDRLWVVPNPAFKRLASTGTSAGTDFVRTELQEDLLLVVPGRLVLQKRPHLVLETAAILKNQYGLTARILFIGDGPAAESLLSTAKEQRLPIEILAWTDEWPSFCPPSSLVLLPTMLEGFGNVLIDAAAAGVVSIASSRALGVSDAIVDNVTGVLTPGDTAHDFALGVLRALEITPLPSHVIEPWLSKFSRSRSTETLLRAIEATVGRN